MERIAMVHAAICLALVMTSCSSGPPDPVQVELVYYRETYSRYDQIYFVGNSCFAEVLYKPRPGSEEGLYIRRIAAPGDVHHHFAPGKRAVGRSGISGVSTYKDRLYFFVNGKQPSVFDPEGDKIIELDDESPYLDDHVMRGRSILYRTPLNHVYYYDLYGDAGMSYRRGERVAVPEGLKLGYINRKKLPESSAFEQLFHEFNGGGGIDYTDSVGFDDKLQTWFFLHDKKPAFVHASRKSDGSWEGREVPVSDTKNRDALPSFYVAFENYHWKFLSPQHFIGPYSPYLEGDALSLDILDAKGRVHETGCVAVDDFDVSPNGRYVAAYGVYRDEAGEESSGLYLFEISYRASINRKGTALRDRGSLDGKTLKQLRGGQKCTVLEHSEFRDDVDGVEDCWYKIRLPNKREGWVFGSYLDFD